MNKPDMEDMKKTLNRTGLIHIAFSVGSKEKVDELTMKLEEAGYPVVSGPRTTGDGYYESCVVAIEENQIEITVYLSTCRISLIEKYDFVAKDVKMDGKVQLIKLQKSENF